MSEGQLGTCRQCRSEQQGRPEKGICGCPSGKSPTQMTREEVEKKRAVIAEAIRGYAENMLDESFPHILNAQIRHVQDRIAPLPEPELPTAEAGQRIFQRMANDRWRWRFVDSQWFPTHWTDTDIAALYSLHPDSKSEQRWTLAEMQERAEALAVEFVKWKDKPKNLTEDMVISLATVFGDKK